MIDKTAILSATQNGLDVFKHYLPFEFKLGRNFKNPFYDDKNASCNIYYDRHNRIFKIKDFGNPDFSGDCFAFVAQIKGLDVRRDFLQVLQIINNDLKLQLEETRNNFTNRANFKEKPHNQSPSTLEKSNSRTTFQPTRFSNFHNINSTADTDENTSKPFEFTEKAFSIPELKFWKTYGISEKTLLYFGVKSLSVFSSVNSDNNRYELCSTDTEPIFGYPGEGFLKLYRPKSKLRFLYGGQIPDTYCFGLKQLPNRGDILFITGGEKDVMSLYAKGFHAVCFNSETSQISHEIIDMLQHRFKHIILLYDADKTGLSASEKHCAALEKFGVQRLLLPLAGTKSDKDISDYFAKGNSRNDFQELIVHFLKTKYTQTMTLIRSCEIDFENPPELSENIISVNGVPLGTQGNLLCITGGEGTGKSNYASAIVSGTLAEEDFEADTLGLTVQSNTAGKAVLLYDTEQSENQLYKNTALLLKRSGKTVKPDWLKAYYLTAMSRRERLQSIRDSMDYYYHVFGGIQLAVIDGVADLIRSANDETESTAIVEELYRLAGIYRTCIICVLHFVPNSFKLRGHLGSELQRKASAILSVEKDTQNPAFSVVKTLKVREGSPLDVPLMQFAWDKRRGMHVYQGEKSQNKKEKRKETELTTIAKEIFSQQKRLTYLDLASELEQWMDVKDRTAKSYIRFMLDNGIVEKDSINTSYYILGKQ